MRILWVSDSPEMQQVGASRVAREYCYRLHEAGQEVHVAGYIPPETKKSNPVKEFKVHDLARFDTKALLDIIDRVKPNAIVLSHDPFMFRCIADIRQRFGNEHTIVGHYTIDGDPPALCWQHMFYMCDLVTLTSRYGERVVRERFFDLRTAAVPHGVNSTWYDCPPDKEKVKSELSKKMMLGVEKLDLTGRAVYCYVGNNQGRKNIAVARDAFKKFIIGKEKDVIWILAMKSCILTEGDLSYIGYYDPGEFDHPNMRVASQFLSDEIIASLYRVSDFLIHPSVGEGFGLTIMEAMASRCVPIVTNYSAVTDFCTDENSILLKDFLLMRGEFDINRALVEPECMLKALELSYDMWKNDHDYLMAMAAQGRETAELYSWDESAKKLLGLIVKTHEDKVRGFLDMPSVIRI